MTYLTKGDDRDNDTWQPPKKKVWQETVESRMIVWLLFSLAAAIKSLVFWLPRFQV